MGMKEDRLGFIEGGKPLRGVGRGPGTGLLLKSVEKGCRRFSFGGIQGLFI